jgi:PAS domain-containing protein
MEPAGGTGTRRTRRIGELLLRDGGAIIEADEAAAALFGYARASLADMHVSRLLSKLTETALRDESTYRHLAYLGHCGAIFNGRRRGGEEFACTVSFDQRHLVSGRALRLMVSETDAKESYRL